jgi:hypothetical protein
MPLPVLAFLPAITAALSGVTASGLLGAATASIAGLLAAESAVEWFNSESSAEEIAGIVNKRLAAAGLDLQFPAFNPATDKGREIVKKTLESFVLQRVNAKAGTEFSSLAGLDQAAFLGEVGKTIARQVNGKTGANLVTVWPVEKLQDDLKTEVLRQFENRGRYAGGALFKGSTLARIKEKIAARHPALMVQVKAQQAGGYWGAPIDEKHAKRREAGKIRQQRYKAKHQQVWVKTVR